MNATHRHPAQDPFSGMCKLPFPGLRLHSNAVLLKRSCFHWSNLFERDEINSKRNREQSWNEEARQLLSEEERADDWNERKGKGVEHEGHGQRYRPQGRDPCYCRYLVEKERACHRCERREVAADQLGDGLAWYEIEA